jgi:Icc-related predicted phosphoesterase
MAQKHFQTKEILWATDVHFPFADSVQLDKFFSNARKGNALIITGDISGGYDIKRWLEKIDEELSIPIYFVLGNHDYYNRTIAETNDIVERFCARHPNFYWLTKSINGFEELDDGVAIVGHEGWYDCHYGVVDGSVILNDFTYIKDLKPLYYTGGLGYSRKPIPQPLIDEFRKLSLQAASHFSNILPEAFRCRDKVVLATHVPPFKEAAWHRGKRSSVEWLPFFSSKIVGDFLKAYMKVNPNKELLVLCGHTHSSGEVQILKNLKVLTGAGEYHFPEIYMSLEL